ncbi:MAG: C10 family peptidase [Tannerella sp.]|jgi:hypothetical protein|nr:C10 family peptidase [Tannerella sp.]
MKKCSILLVVLSLFTLMQAENVSTERALKIATQYYRLSDEVSLRNSVDPLLVLAYTEKADGVDLRSSAAPEACFYVFNSVDGEGFIIVSGDDRACPILGSSFNGAFDPDNLPPNLKAWLKQYSKEIAWMVKENPDQPADPEWAQLEAGASPAGVELRKTVLLTTASWGQEDPYNLACPMSGSKRTATGCVATAIAIILKYHADNGYKASGKGSHSYTWNGKTVSATFGTYDWANMPNATSSYKTTTQRTAVSKLMYNCAVSIESKFGTDATSSNSFYAFTGLNNYFGLDKRYMRFIHKEDYTDSQWKKIIRNEIDKKRPVLYGGDPDAGDSGHEFVLDGYNDTSDQFHVNWGWDGSYNGYFRLTSLKGGANPNYKNDQEMIIGIQKSVTANASNLTYFGPEGGISVDWKRFFMRVTASKLLLRSYESFNGRLGIALIDAKGNIKQIVAEREDEELEFGYSYGILFVVNDAFSYLKTDVLRCVSSEDNGRTWNVIYGGESGADLETLDYYSMSVEEIASQDVHVYSIPNGIVIDSPASETVQIYTLAGQLVFSGVKEAGKATFSVSLPRGVVLVRGDGWAEKVPVK